MKKYYLTPETRLAEYCLEKYFAQTGYSGDIDPGEDENWGNL